MNDTTEADWYLVCLDANGDPRAVAKNGAPQGWRRLSNIYRGRTLKVSEKLIQQCLKVSGPIAEDAGHENVFAAPVVGPSGIPHAVLLSTSPSPGDIPQVGVWQWTFPVGEVGPPSLNLTTTALDLLGVATEHRDRSVYGPADFFTRALNLSEILPHLGFLYDSSHGDQQTARTLMQGEDGKHLDLHFAEQVTAGPAGERTVNGLCWPAAADPKALVTRSVDIELATALATAGAQFVAVGDIRFPTAPYVVKWVTAHPPGLGHGVSTGQTPGIHEDDLGRLFEYVMQLGSVRPGEEAPRLEGIRARRAGGGWISGSGRGFRLNERYYPTIWVALITPDNPEL